MAYEPSSPEEAAFLESYDPSKFPITVVTVDVVVIDESGKNVLLIERAKWPYRGRLALPGGFVNQDETVRQAAARELLEETGVDLVGDEQRLFGIGVADAPDRDPRARAISHVFYAKLDGPAELEAGDDAATAKWHPLVNVKGLAFDHDVWVEKVRAFLSFEPIVLEGSDSPLYDATVAATAINPHALVN